MITPNIENIIKSLVVKAGVMEMGEKIAWGSDTALMRQAAAALQTQAERIKELERESETHAKAYGLAIVERNKLRTEVEAVRKANLDCVDHYNAALDEINELGQQLKTAQEGWRCECSTDDACRFARERDALRAELAEIAADEPVMFAYEYSDGSWHDASSTEHSAGMKPLFTRPMPAQDVTEFDESQFKSVEYLIAYLNKLNSYRDRTLEALSKYKGAK